MGNRPPPELPFWCGQSGNGVLVENLENEVPPRAFTMRARLVTAIAFSTVIVPTVRADLVATFDFSDTSTWLVTVTTNGATDNGSGVIDSGSALYVDQSGIGTVLVTASLIGSINTMGFTDLTLHFINETTAGGLEFTAGADEYGAASSDGFSIESSEGILFDTEDAGSAFEAALDDGTSWNDVNAVTFGQDLIFDTSTENGSISDMLIRMQVDAASEAFELRGFQVHGTASVPEPSAFAFAGLVAALVGVSASAAKLRKKLSSRKPDLAGRTF